MAERPVAHAADAAAVRNARENFRAEPLIVSGQMNDWPMLESPLQSLHELAGAATVEALHLRYDLQGVQCGHSTHEMCLSELISRATASEGLTDCAWYLQWRELPHPRQLVSEMGAAGAPMPAPLQLPPHDAARLVDAALRRPAAIEDAALQQVNAWIGCSRTSHLHFDGCDNLLVVAHGSKTVLLWSPWQLPSLYPQTAPTERWKSRARSTLYLRDDDDDDFPRLRAAPRLRAQLTKGDALWIPAGWWHEVLTPSLCVAFNFWCTAHKLARLRPTMLHLRSDTYAEQFAGRVSESDTLPRRMAAPAAGARVHLQSRQGRSLQTLPVAALLYVARCLQASEPGATTRLSATCSSLRATLAAEPATSPSLLYSKQHT